MVHVLKQIRVGYKAYDQAEEKYQEEVKRLDKIAHHVLNSDYGFLQRTLASAWLFAISSDKRILREAWASIVTKYNLAIENEPARARKILFLKKG